MIRYGKKKTTYKIHPHNECGICSPEAGDSNLARQEAKKEIEKELIEYLEEDKKWDIYKRLVHVKDLQMNANF